MIDLSADDVIALNEPFNTAKEPWVNRPLVESAFSSYMYYEDEIEQICSIYRGIAKNHAFSEGNKRTASAALGVCLAQRGYAVDPMAMADLSLDVAEHDYSVATIARKLRAILKPIEEVLA